MALGPSRLNVYVDGFNLYYGALQRTPNKWCDLGLLFRQLLSALELQKIRYFSVRVNPRPNNPQIHVRQQLYFRALKTLPEVSIHLGQFRETTVKMKTANPGPTIPPYVDVIKTEEKGSDVNLASFLLRDCFRGEFDVAAVVSNDTDLITPIRMVVEDFGCDVVILNPFARPANDLRRAATQVLPIRAGVLGASQFPDQMTDSAGTFHKPPGW